MKSKLLKMAVTAALVLSACMISAAQDVDGISLWDKYTKAQLVQKYGQPVEYRSQEGDNEEDGLTEYITFKDIDFHLEGNQVVDYDIKTDKPRALTKTIKGGIGIGDDASVLNPIKDKLFSTKTLKDGVTEYSYWLDRDIERWIYVDVKGNKIVYIWTYTRLL